MKKLKATFTLSDFIVAKLDTLAKELGEKKSHIVEQALDLYFDRLDEKVADSRLKKLQEGKTHTIPADEVFKGL